MKSRPGFTLLELLTVIGVAAVLTAIGLPAMQAMRQNAALNGGTQEFVSVLRQAQGRALAGQGNADHRVHNTSNKQYEVVAGTTTASYTLPESVTFSANFDITFLRRYGTIATQTTIDISGSSQTKHIIVSPTGLITIQ